MKFHYIRELVENNEITVKYVPTDRQLADIFTKTLPKSQFSNLCALLGIVNALKRREC